MDYQLLPGRMIPPKSRGLTGQLTLSNGRAVPFESGLERDALILLDFAHKGRRIETQPFTLEYHFQGKKRRYTPDMLVQFADDEEGTVDIIEVKFAADLSRDLPKLSNSFEKMKLVCEERNWGFKIWTEADIRGNSYLENATFLRRYLRGTYDPEIAAQIKQMIVHQKCTPNELLDALFKSSEKRLEAMACLWHLMANRVVSCDMCSPIKMNTTQLWIM